MKTGLELKAIDRDHIWHPFTSFGNHQSPVFITSAKGVYLHTDDGRKIIDAVSSWWVNLHGHSHPEIARAVHEQAMELEHVIFAGFTHKPAVTLAANLLTVLPPNQVRLFFSDNGSTAVEVAIKMALQFFHNRGERRSKIVALDGAYHGDTFGSMSVGSRSVFTAAFEELLFDVVFIPFPSDTKIDDAASMLRQVCEEGDVAAFIYEPLVQGASGMNMYPASNLERLIREAREHGALCIADEVFTGFGRTGKWFASDYVNSAPDIMAVSKGITGGALPLGVTSCSAQVVESFMSSDPMHTFFHGHSYTANPIACAAANASFGLMSESTTWERIRRIESKHAGFTDRMSTHRHIAQARCLGTILALELKTPENTSYFNAVGREAYRFFLERNVLLRPLGNVIYVLPPYVITDDELERIYAVITEFLESI